jgi:hypothetical protein
LWFYSCLASIILGELITSPYFTSPADVIANTIAAIIAMFSVNPWTLKFSDTSRFFWLFTVVFIIVILLASFVQIVLKESKSPFWRKISRALYIFTSNGGSHKVIFSAIILFALYTFHSESAKETFTISIAWVALIAIHPIEAILGIFLRIREVFVKSSPDVIGEVAGHEFPNIILVKHLPEKSMAYGDPIVVQADNGQVTVGCVLDQMGFTGELWHRVLRLPLECQPAQNQLKELLAHYPTGTFRYQIDSPKNIAIEEYIDKVGNQLIGVVAPDSDVMKLKIEIVRSDLDLSEGRLIEASIGCQIVLYQIVNGLTREEILEQRNSRGYVRAEARKIGKWEDEHFQSVKWVPEPNTPVFLVNVDDPTFDRSSIGVIPGTNYHISVDLNSLVTHNTAILGILGVGKSFLALELIERLIAQKIKVICLDITNQYSKELLPYINGSNQNDEIMKLDTIGKRGRNQCKQNVEEGGSIKEFQDELRKQLTSFLNEKIQPDYLRIINPTSFEVWRQDSKPYNNIASMATLTPCEITRIITETTLEILQNSGMSEDARCCLVFEEAHSLVPEWNSAVNEGDKSATNGTAKAILQGRKYGLGCLLITQRTANVTKSILNQCNTVFALRTFDSTGVDFLKNFVGDDYAGILSGVEDRHAVVFGKASSCKTPVMVRLNDRETFLDYFRLTAIVDDKADQEDDFDQIPDDFDQIPDVFDQAPEDFDQVPEDFEPFDEDLSF